MSEDLRDCGSCASTIIAETDLSLLHFTMIREMVLLPRLWVEEVLKLLQEQVGGSKGKEKETGDASNDAQRSVA